MVEIRYTGEALWVCMDRADDFDPNPDIVPNTYASNFQTVEFATLV